MVILSPAKLGLPPKFDSWRPTQVAALKVFRSSTKRIIALNMPTGSGKSLAYMGEAVISDIPTCITTNSKGLQNQLMYDFQECGLVDIRGKRNYACNMKPDYTCEDGGAAKCPYRGSIACPLSQAEMRAATSKLVVTNYDKWTSAKKYGQGMTHFEQLIMDEGHEIPEALSRAVQVIIHHREIQEELKLDFPAEGVIDEMENWKEWAAETGVIAQEEMIQARAKLDTPDPKQAWIRKYLHLKNLCRRLMTIATCRAQNWVVDKIKEGYQFDPIRPGIYAEAFLLLRVPRIIIMSATLSPKTLYMTGIRKDSFEFHEFESDFPPERCPIYYVPVMRVDRWATNLGPLWTVLDQFLSRRRDRKGIIHTISYDRAVQVMQTSRYGSSMILGRRGESATVAVERFKKSGPGTILVSPVVSTGYDFPMTDAEFQFICKIPFLDGRSKIIKARQADDREYAPYKACQDMEQMCGRPMRSKEDQCETLICDAHMDWFGRQWAHLFTKNFKKRFKRLANLPVPPRSLYENYSGG